MILMQAPGPNLGFGAQPSGSSYVSDSHGLIYIVNNSVADQLSLISAGCATLAPFGGLNFGFNTLASLYGADAAQNLVIPNLVGYPEYTVATVYADAVPANIGTWVKTGAGNGVGNWTQTSILTFAALNAQFTASVPWAGQTAAQVAQLQIALQNAGQFNAVDNAMTADPTQPVNAWWTTGGIVVLGGTLSAFIQTTLGWTAAQMTGLFQAAQAVSL